MVTFVVRIVSKENTFKGVVGEFIVNIGSKIKETRTLKHSEMRVGGRMLEETSV